MATYRTKDGESVDYIAYKYYGHTNNKIVEQIFNANPRLSDQPAALPANLIIELPELKAAVVSTKKRVKLWD